MRRRISGAWHPDSSLASGWPGILQVATPHPAVISQHQCGEHHRLGPSWIWTKGNDDEILKGALQPAD